MARIIGMQSLAVCGYMVDDANRARIRCLAGECWSNVSYSRAGMSRRHIAHAAASTHDVLLRYHGTYYP